MKIDSEKVVVNADVNTVFNFLKDANNIGELLPQDDVKDFTATQTECSFKVQGGIIITLEQKEMIENQQIIMKAGAKSPFPFDLTIFMQPQGDQTQGYIHFDGKVNAFLKMMVQKPLTNLFNYMTNKIKEKYEA
ncbi:hypothetical protein SAMN05216474_1040 [Lishizhenia tianjinensis]|uniref:Polyketide cyclase / dehydrase and lipid transport n=1 Tax=Lishizhenia tianjinensis TaxID=477690 RepID=A0A1I6YNA9_9FLAO|nr:hypothetical protein [Lishizhenia tianjinensis]SFT51912.1 hypothetical protein SAMN05216474_1040 [Lishizhenia tianjinensis]